MTARKTIDFGVTVAQHREEFLLRHSIENLKKRY